MLMMLHIAKKTDWELAKEKGYYTVPSLEKQGFIHCSYEEQILRVANANFKGHADLVLLTIDPRKVKAEIKDENLEGGQEMFPHIYGQLEVGAVIEVCPFPAKPDGFFELPEMKSKPQDKKPGGLKP